MSNPSPACEVKDGSGSYATAIGGVDVTPGNTVTIRLSSSIDVEAWTIECITTDDQSDAATVTTSLTIDTFAFTATFTAPIAGKAYRFRSTINRGRDEDNVARSDYSTTFCVYTPVNGRRVSAADETNETNTTFGWTKWHNDLIRSMPAGSGTSWSGGGGGGGSFSLLGSNNQFIYYQGGSGVGATGLDYTPTTGVVNIARGLLVKGTAVATMASAMIVAGTAATGFNLVRPVSLSPIIGGTAVFTGTDIVADGLASHKPVSVVRYTSTTDAAVTSVFAFRPLDEAITNVVVEANAVPSGSGGGGSYVRLASIMMDGGVGTCSAVESGRDTEFRATGIGFTGIAVGTGVTIGVSGATGFVNVKGTPTGQIKWGLTITLQATS